MIYFEIPGKAEGKGRPRFTRNGHTYTPDKTRLYEDRVRASYKQLFKEPPTDEAVTISIIVIMTPAKSLSKKKRAELMEHPPIKKPDVDNIAKIILDALNGIAWMDDKQVCSLSVCKAWGDKETVLVGITKESEL